MTPQEQFEQFIEDHKLTMTHKFVPFSLSRNAEEKDKTLNWKVTLKSPQGQFTFDYQKGVGHLPYPSTYMSNLNGYQKRVVQEAIETAAETGVARKLAVKGKDVTFGLGNATFPNPTIREVLESLSLDSEVKNYLSFESWAKEYGYDQDSRQAEKVYKACQKSAENLSKILGGSNKIDTIREICYELDNEPSPKKVKP